MASALTGRCPCLRGEVEDVRTLDFRHCGLQNVPSDVFQLERTLEELFLDSNQIRDLPRVKKCYSWEFTIQSMTCICDIILDFF